MTPSAPPPAWSGRLVRLRQVEPDDWEGFWRNDDDTDAQRHSWRIPLPRSAERARAWAREQSLENIDSADRFGLAITTLEAPRVVGHINAHGIDRRNGTFEYGLGVFRSERRQGFPSDAVQVLLRYMFAELRFQRAGAGVYEFNTASLALHRALGFSEEGRIRRSVFTGGEYHDEILFGMTAEEFSARHGAAGSGRSGPP